MRPFDWLVLGSYALAVLLIAGRVARPRNGGAQQVEDWMLAGRTLPTAAVWASMLATELSAATFIGVPHAAYLGDWSYLQFAWGALLGKFLAARTFIPLYHRLGVVTVYGFIRERFGDPAQRATAAAFVVGRLLASGVRLYIAALAFSVVTGLGLPTAILVCGALATLYTFFGGIRAVIWTDVLQAGVFILAAVSALYVLSTASDTGWAGLFEWAGREGKLSSFHFPSWTPPSGGAWLPHLRETFLADGRAFFTALIGGCALTLATHVTDHDMVQRLLVARTARSGARALFVSGLTNFPVTVLFLSVGTGLAFFYQNGASYDLSDTQRILPLFALHELPSGLRGLVFAGLFAAAMSSLDSAICAIGATLVTDLARRRPTLATTRALSVAVGCALMASALLMGWFAARAVGEGWNLVEFALSAMTMVYGGLLGVFLLGLLSRSRGNGRSVQAGLACGVIVGALLFLQPLLGVQAELRIAWPWWIPAAAAASFGVASLGERGVRG